MGMERLRVLGIETGIITGEKSLNVKRRAEKLKLKHLYLGVKDKSAALARIRQETGFSDDEIAYIGDDVNDLGIMDIVGEHGLTATPADGMPQVRAMAHYICAWRGGNGAFRVVELRIMYAIRSYYETRRFLRAMRRCNAPSHGPAASRRRVWQ